MNKESSMAAAAYEMRMTYERVIINDISQKKRIEKKLMQTRELERR